MENLPKSQMSLVLILSNFYLSISLWHHKVSRKGKSTVWFALQTGFTIYRNFFAPKTFFGETVNQGCLVALHLEKIWQRSPLWSSIFFSLFIPVVRWNFSTCIAQRYTCSETGVRINTSVIWGQGPYC